MVPPITVIWSTIILLLASIRWILWSYDVRFCIVFSFLIDDFGQGVLKTIVLTTKGRTLCGECCDVDVGCYRRRYSKFIVDCC